MTNRFRLPRPIPNPFPPSGANSLGSDWLIDEDGYPGRQAARIILFDSHDRILLISGHDFSDASHRWWFTPGGGIKAGENPQVAALRELKEETGIELNITQLTGPVLYRESLLKFHSLWAIQAEQYFLARLDQDTLAPNASGWTLSEKQLLDELSWIPVSELASLNQQQTIYPTKLADFASKWLAGWDGSVHTLYD